MSNEIVAGKIGIIEERDIPIVVEFERRKTWTMYCDHCNRPTEAAVHVCDPPHRVCLRCMEQLTAVLKTQVEPV